ncbi:MAG: helix-turn-helix domain-containing protein [Candidatus Omnitrophota bacterium]
MGEEKLLTIRDVSLFLGISEKEVIDLAESQAIPAYRIGGVYLRFKPQQIEAYRQKHKQVIDKNKLSQKSSSLEKIKDFFYFNDFYIFSVLIIVVIVIIIFRGN